MMHDKGTVLYEGSHRFICHPHVYWQVEWTVRSCLYCSAAERHHTLAGTHFPSHWG